MWLMCLLKTVAECNLRSRRQEYCERPLCLPRIVVIEAGSLLQCFPLAVLGCVARLTTGTILGGRVVIARRYDSDDSHHYHWEYCCEFSHVQPWMFIGLPGIWWPCFILLLVWLPLSRKPNPSKEDSWYALRFHSESSAENTWSGYTSAFGIPLFWFLPFRKIVWVYKRLFSK